jgi:hypothetical protein
VINSVKANHTVGQNRTVNDHASNQKAFWASLVVLVIGFNLLTTFASRRRLKRWAEEEGVKILKKSSDFGLDAPEEISHFSRWSGGAYYVTIEYKEQNVFTAWIDIGSIFANILDKKPKVIWDNRPEYLRR